MLYLYFTPLFFSYSQPLDQTIFLTILLCGIPFPCWKRYYWYRWGFPFLIKVGFNLNIKGWEEWFFSLKCWERTSLRKWVETIQIYNRKGVTKYSPGHFLCHRTSLVEWCLVDCSPPKEYLWNKKPRVRLSLKKKVK